MIDEVSDIIPAPVEEPAADAPVATQRVVITVMLDGSITIQSTPDVPKWALVGLFATLMKNLGA